MGNQQVNRLGFTLLEVLMAIVLLAVVVGVSVPFLQEQGGQDRVSDRSEFQAKVAQELAKFQLGRSEPITYHSYAEFAQSHGWECNRVEQSGVQQPNEEVLGEWLVLSDASNRSIYWAMIETAPGDGP